MIVRAVLLLTRPSVFSPPMLSFFLALEPKIDRAYCVLHFPSECVSRAEICASEGNNVSPSRYEVVCIAYFCTPV